MNNVFKYAAIVFAGNIILFVLLLMITNAVGDNLDVALTLLFLVPILLLLFELIFGIIFAAGKSKKDFGKGLLIGCGITVLIGLSVCGILAGM